MEKSRFDPPDDLPSQNDESQCQTDVTVIVTEPKVEGFFGSDVGDSHTGMSWSNVADVTVTLSSGGRQFECVTNGQGYATFADVPCGAYFCKLSQSQFSVERLARRVLTVNAARKSGREFEEPVRRRLQTMEMFRLPTRYLLAAGIKEDPTYADDTYGHHWLKIYDTESDTRRENARYSYGWWPKYGVSGSIGAVAGVEGSLNGVPTYSQDRNRDPYHRKSRTYENLEDVFFPYVTNGHSAQHYKDEIRRLALAFEKDVSDQWSWRTDDGGWHCKTFQAYIMSNTRVWRNMTISPGEYLWRVSI